MRLVIRFIPKSVCFLFNYVTNYMRIRVIARRLTTNNAYLKSFGIYIQINIFKAVTILKEVNGRISVVYEFVICHDSQH